MGLTPMLASFTWRERTGSGLYGPTFTDHANTPARIQHQYRVVRKPDGTEITSQTLIISDAQVKADDFCIVDGTIYPVMTVDSIEGIGNETLQYEVRL